MKSRLDNLGKIKLILNKLSIRKLKVVIIAAAVTSLLGACGKPVETSAKPETGKEAEAGNTAGDSAEGTDTAADVVDTSSLKTINIGFPSSGSDWSGGLLGVANEEGYLDEYLNPLGYKAEMQGFVGAAPAIHEALVSKDLDYVVYAGMAGVLGKANQIDTQLLGITAFTSMWRMVASTDSGIESIDDLEGKSVSYQRGASPQMYMLRVLNEAGVKYEDVEGVNMTLPDGLAGVATGSIDAAVVSAGQEAQLVEEGKAVVIHKGFEADKDVYYEPTVLIGRTEIIEEDSEVGVAIIKALFKARDKIAEDLNAYYELSAERSGNPLEVVLATAEDDTDIAFPLNLEEKYITSLQDIEVFLTDNELIAGSVDYNEWVNTALIEKALEEYNSEK